MSDPSDAVPADAAPAEEVQQGEEIQQEGSEVQASEVQQASQMEQNSSTEKINSSKVANSFWKTTNSDFSGTSLAQGGKLLTMEQLIRRTDDLKKPVRPQVDDEDFLMMNTVKLEGQETAAERVLSAHVLPKRFPVDPDRLIYPPIREKNPLYYTTSTLYGSEKPRPHQVPEAFFPKSNKFSKSYTDSKPRHCGLNTSTDKNHFEF